MKVIRVQRDVLIFILLLLTVLVAKWKTLSLPYYWDETIWVQGAYWLSKVNLLRVIPGFHPDAIFDYHPPVLHLSGAAFFKLFGNTSWVCHFLIVLISFLGVFFTYLLGSFLHGRMAGIFASLFLFLSPIYFAQSGMFLGDLPVAAFGVMCIFFALKGLFIPYLVCGTYLIFIKETSMAIFFSILVYFYLTERKAGKATFFKILKYGLPFAFVIGFFVLQKIVTGRFCHMDAWGRDRMFIVELQDIFHAISSVTQWLLIRQHRIWLTLLIILNFAFFRASRLKKENLLFLLLLCSSGYSFAFLQFLPRYLLPLLPVFCILAGWSLTRIIPSVKLQCAVAFLLCFLLIHSFTSGKVVGTSEWDMKYRHVIDLHQKMSVKLEKDFSESRIVTSWPLARQLNTPYLGYVQKPLKTYQVNPEKGLPKLRKKDLLYWSEPPTIDGDMIKGYAAQKRLPVIIQFSNGQVNAVLYGKSLPSYSSNLPRSFKNDIH